MVLSQGSLCRVLAVSGPGSFCAPDALVRARHPPIPQAPSSDPRATYAASRVLRAPNSDPPLSGSAGSGAQHTSHRALGSDTKECRTLTQRAPGPDIDNSAGPRHKEPGPDINASGPDTETAGERRSPKQRALGEDRRAPTQSLTEERRVRAGHRDRRRAPAPGPRQPGTESSRVAGARHRHGPRAPEPDTEQHRAPTQRAPRLDTERRSPTQRVPGPDRALGSDTETTGARHAFVSAASLLTKTVCTFAFLLPFHV